MPADYAVIMCDVNMNIFNAKGAEVLFVR